MSREICDNIKIAHAKHLSCFIRGYFRVVINLRQTLVIRLSDFKDHPSRNTLRSDTKFEARNIIFYLILRIQFNLLTRIQALLNCPQKEQHLIFEKVKHDLLRS